MKKHIFPPPKGFIAAFNKVTTSINAICPQQGCDRCSVEGCNDAVVDYCPDCDSPFCENHIEP